MKQYQQATVLIIVLFFSILFTNPKPQKARAILINEPIAQSSVVLETAPTPAFVEETIVQPSAYNDAPPLKINSALAFITTSNEILYELNTNQRWPLASLTKLMTAVVALESAPANAERDTYIKRMMVISDNAAADALSNTLGAEQYLELMNEKAAMLGMDHTSFFDLTGLSYLNQSTVRDIKKLVVYILKRHPNIFAWSAKKTLAINGETLKNINHFAGRADFLGGKTGFTDEANGNLVSLFTTKQGPLAIIIFGTPNKEERFIETDKLRTWLSQHFKL